jgi:hypothetical protein
MLKASNPGIWEGFSEIIAKPSSQRLGGGSEEGESTGWLETFPPSGNQQTSSPPACPGSSSLG